MHFAPMSASWLNMVERFFRNITTARLRRGVVTSLLESIGSIDEYIAHHNIKPKSFIWTTSARNILQKSIRANSSLSSKKECNTTLANNPVITNDRQNQCSPGGYKWPICNSNIGPY